MLNYSKNVRCVAFAENQHLKDHNKTQETLTNGTVLAVSAKNCLIAVRCGQDPSIPI